MVASINLLPSAALSAIRFTQVRSRRCYLFLMTEAGVGMNCPPSRGLRSWRWLQASREAHDALCPGYRVISRRPSDYRSEEFQARLYWKMIKNLDHARPAAIVLASTLFALSLWFTGRHLTSPSDGQRPGP